MKYINKYNTKAQYDADANRPTTDRTVSSIVESGEVKFDGKNVLVDKPGASIGDILVYNTKTASLIVTAKWAVEYIVKLSGFDAAVYRDWETDRKSTRLNSSHSAKSRMPSYA